MNIFPQMKIVGEELEALLNTGDPTEIVSHIDEAIRPLTLISEQVGDAFPHQIDSLRAAQLGRTRVRC